MIKNIILFLCLIGVVLHANEQPKPKKLTYEVSASLLKGLDSDAIVLGSGEKILYVFIDPLCPHSRKFVTMVSKNPVMLSKYQYRFLLYSIPRLKSTDVVSAIYVSKNPIESLLQVMIDKNIVHDKGNEKTKAKAARIVDVGETIGVSKRPYIFIKK
ncbi:MAG: Unknown protein [uncultured Sulfurovum sp.]|uniref:Thioredoxin-like fold domain-containing protein n=1 Tax=uncultured Sulfurovum sp. TaxID=269237 RepID=A0A6S6TJ14_9BACT|nr:MAG: Unknown protein [uncultured Sulfurovum sp.]